jgi:lipopolysaccharide export system protein LptC
MMQRYSAWFPVVLLAILAAVTVWLDREVQPPESTGDSRARHDPDYYVDHLKVTRMGPAGIPDYILFARKMTHYPDDDVTHLDEPRLISYRSAVTTTTVTSLTANMSGNGENVYLHDNVQLVRAAYADHSELTMQTSYLHVIPDANLAKTDQPVTIFDANILVTAIGLEFNSETHILKLLANVKGKYEKPPTAR